MAIVPYAYANRFRYASRVGKFAWENRSDIKRAAQRIYRTYKKTRAQRQKSKVKGENFSPKNIGKPIGTSDAKTWETHNVVATTGNTRELYSYSLIRIPEGTMETNRERQIINCSGIKICTEWQNNKASSTLDTVYINMAVISPKEAVCGDLDLTVQFFGAQGGVANDRTRDFDTTLTSNEFRCLPINTDKWVVLKRKTIRLGPSFANCPNDSYTANVDWYIKINRQLQFAANPEVQEAINPIYFVWWADEVFEPAGNLGQANSIRYGVRSIVYWRDPK